MIGEWVKISQVRADGTVSQERYQVVGFEGDTVTVRPHGEGALMVFDIHSGRHLNHPPYRRFSSVDFPRHLDEDIVSQVPGGKLEWRVGYLVEEESFVWFAWPHRDTDFGNPLVHPKGCPSCGEIVELGYRCESYVKDGRWDAPMVTTCGEEYAQFCSLSCLSCVICRGIEDEKWSNWLRRSNKNGSTR